MNIDIQKGLETFKTFLVSKVAYLEIPTYLYTMVDAHSHTKHIITHCCQLFHKYGIKSVTMTHIAQTLGVSKKTLYNHFPTKANLVSAVTEQDYCDTQVDILKITEEAKDAIDELLTISRYVIQEFGDMNPSLLFDMEKYYPQSWKQHMEFKSGFILESTASNLKRGIEEGLYRTDFNIDVICRLHLAKMEAFFDHGLFPPHKYSFAQVHDEYIHYHIHGLATPKGLKVLDQYDVV